MARCAVDYCDSPAAKRGWCNAHYLRWRRNGDPLVTKKQERPADGRCTIEGCERPWLSRGMCRAHYEASRGGYPRHRQPRSCSLEDCDRPLVAFGYCSKHHRRYKLYGDPLALSPAPARKGCSVEGCTDEHYAKTLCRSHYWIRNKHGDPLAVPRRGAKRQRLESYPDVMCAACGTEFSPGTSASRIYCSRRCRPSYRGGGATSNRYAIERLGRTHGWYCHLCGEDIDSSFYWPSPHSPTVDHILPVFHGGTDEPENLALAHWGCNLARGKRLVVNQLQIGARTLRQY